MSGLQQQWCPVCKSRFHGYGFDGETCGDPTCENRSTTDV